MNNKTRERSNRIFFLFLFILLPFPPIHAEKTRIGIVFDADTTIVNQYIGFTMFSNSTDSSLIQINLKEHIINKLKSHLEVKYDVDLISLPDSLQNKGIGFLEGGLGKKLSKWGNTKKEDCDIIIFIRNQTFPREWNILVPPNTSGIYARRKNVYLYTTITFYAYQTEKNKVLDYYTFGGDYLHHLKGFRLPRERAEIDNEMLNFLNDEYVKYLDQRIEDFLTKSFLVPNLEKGE